jgi:hypothetical protein
MSTPTIVRKGYTRRAYERKAFVRSDGVRVSATHIPRTHVPPARIPARGMATITGHKGKPLIDMKDYRHLRNYGYSLSKPVDQRRSALRAAATAEGFPWVIHRVTAVRTLLKNTEPLLDKKLNSDDRYVQELYKKYKADRSRRALK